MIKKIFHPYTIATINKTETWLAKMAESGWKLKKIKKWTFVFESILPQKKKFFIYSALLEFDRGKKIINDILNIEKKYKKNSSSARIVTSSFFEVDMSKLDDEYFSFVKTRNQYFKKNLFIAIICSFILLCFSAIPIIISKDFWPIILPFGIATVLSILLFITSFFDTKSKKRK